MQSSLFEDGGKNVSKSLDEVNAEIFEQGKARYPNRVFILGTGPANAEIVIVGESPGPPDVATGKPFSGPSGELLERMMAAIEVRLDDCYRTNVVKFISQGDEITQVEMQFFTPLLLREILSLSPKVIILLGNTPSRAVLNTKTPISKLRGQVHDFQGINAIATFNPAFLLRDPTKKREAWDDMKLVRDQLAAGPAA
jgi:uracil-DNA glycosylase family 4